MAKIGKTCIKYLLFLFNLIFVVGGLTLIVIGIVVKVKGVTIFGDTDYVSMPIIIIAFGLGVFVIAFLGCCGAMHEGIIKLSLYGVLLFVVFFLQLAAIILAFLNRDTMDSLIRENMKKSLAHQKKDAVKVWDKLQVGWKCCGVDGPKDYKNDSLSIPKSCCKPDSSGDCTESNAFEEGCYKQLVMFILTNIKLFGAIGGIIAVVELAGGMFSFCLVSSIRNENKARAPPPHSPRSPYRY